MSTYSKVICTHLKVFLTRFFYSTAAFILGSIGFAAFVSHWNVVLQCHMSFFGISNDFERLKSELCANVKLLMLYTYLALSRTCSIFIEIEIAFEFYESFIFNTTFSTVKRTCFSTCFVRAWKFRLNFHEKSTKTIHRTIDYITWIVI